MCFFFHIITVLKHIFTAEKFNNVKNVMRLWFNPLTPNDLYMSSTAPLTSKRCILYIYSTNVGTEYFKHALNSPFLFLSSKCSSFHNANLFGSCIIHILYTGCAKIKKHNSGAKGLTGSTTIRFCVKLGLIHVYRTVWYIWISSNLTTRADGSRSG